MVKTVEERKALKHMLNQKVRVIARVSDFSTAKASYISTERRPTILLKNVMVIKGNQITLLDHIWILPKGSLLRKEICDGDLVMFTATVYSYKKFDRRKKNTIVKTYGLTNISDFRIIYENPKPKKSLKDVYVLTMI